MPDYGLVARQINNLTNQIRSETAAERADKLAMSNLGLQQAQLGLQQRTAQGQQDIALAKAKREQWLSEPVTIGQAIDTHPKWNDQQKQAIKMSLPEKVRDNFLNHMTTRGQLNDAVMKLQESQKTEDYRGKMLGLKKRELDIREKEGVKPTQALSQLKLDAWRSYMRGSASPAEQALIGVDKDPYLSDAMKLVASSGDIFGQPISEVVKKVYETADEFRKNRYQMPGGQNTPPPPAGFEIDY